VTDLAPKVFRQKPNFADRAAVEKWFVGMADVLLNRSLLVAGSTFHRIVEVEVYYSSPEHPDPFAHCFPIQREFGRWYFHRVGPSYRGGSYKGLDVTFGDGEACTGILIRTLQRSDGTIVNGPSLVVDSLLHLTAKCSVQTLDRAIADRSAWSSLSPLRLVLSENRVDPLVRTARVGLSMKRFANQPTANDYLERRYRFLTEPGLVKKGKPQTIRALLRDGHATETIVRLTQTRNATVLRYLAESNA